MHLRLNILLVWNCFWFFLFFQALIKAFSTSFGILTIYLLCLPSFPSREGTGLGRKGIFYHPEKSGWWGLKVVSSQTSSKKKKKKESDSLLQFWWWWEKFGDIWLQYEQGLPIHLLRNIEVKWTFSRNAGALLTIFSSCPV